MEKKERKEDYENKWERQYFDVGQIQEDFIEG